MREKDEFECENEPLEKAGKGSHPAPEAYPPTAPLERCSRLTMLASFCANAMRACAALEVAAAVAAVDGDANEESSESLSARALPYCL